MMTTFKKVKTWAGARQLVTQWQDEGRQVVFTNGCFDLLHFGHIYLLRGCKQWGDKLVVGLNSSASIRRLKGPHRPLQDDQSRLAVLDALDMVDLIVIFEEDTPLKLINTLRPDVLVKGGDYQSDQIVGAAEIKSWGGKVVLIPFQTGYATTLLEQKIKQG